MSFDSRSPSVKITMDKDLFNRLVAILDYNHNLGIEFANFSSTSKKLKDKILSYSVPRIDSEGNDFVDVRFYPIEASNIISQLLVSKDDIKPTENYYSTLFVRKK